jgi:hypothetical protein
MAILEIEAAIQYLSLILSHYLPLPPSPLTDLLAVEKLSSRPVEYS